MTSENEARVRGLLVKLREEMRWLDVLRMLAAGGYPMLAREGFEEKIKAVASGADDADGDDAGDEGDASAEHDVVDAQAVVRDKLASFTLPATYAKIMYVPAAIMTGPIASPSRPSVRFTAFEAPTNTSIANGR